MALSPSPDHVMIPGGLPPWVVAFVREAERENQTLAENGAAQAVTAREALLQRLVAAAQHYLNGEISVEEAARLLGKHPETIRRAVRKGSAAGRPRQATRHGSASAGGTSKRLLAPRTARYDPVADAQDIAKRRRPL